MNSKMRSLIAVLLSSFVIFGCTKKNDSNEKVLNIRAGAKVKGMDPAFSNDRYSSNEIGKVYEGLLEYHYLKRPFTLVPNLAESLPTVSEDGLTYTFKIKKGVKFHDNECFPDGKGRELVAEDFVYTLKRIADPKLQSTGWWVMDGKILGLNEWRTKYSDQPKADYSEEVAGVKALDKYTLQITLAKPFPQFLYGLAMPFYFVVPKEAVEKYGKEFLNHPVGTGPFVLPKFSQSNKIVYTKNPTFRKKLFPSEGSPEFAKMAKEYGGKQLPLVDKIIVNIMVESQPAWLSFQKGKVDYLGIPKDNFDQVVTPEKDLSPDMKKKGISLSIVPSLDVTYTAFNHTHPLFKNNKKLRQALSLAYNTQKSNELFFNNTAMSAQSVVPPGIAGYMKDYQNPYKQYDLERAKQLLAEAGYPGGKGLPEITYDTSASTVSRQMGEFFRQQMEKIGVKIKVYTNPWPELQKKIKTLQTMLYGIAWGADYPDAENFLQLLYGPNKTPGANGSNYNNEEFNKLFAKAAVMQDSPERTSLYEQLNKLVAEEVPWIFGVHRQSFTLKSGWLKNFVVSDFEWSNWQYIDIDLKKKQELLDSKY